LRGVALLILLVSLGASAQQAVDAAPPPPPPPPPTEAERISPPPGPPRGASLSEHEKAKNARYGKFAAGPGGPLLIFSEIISGMIFGGSYGGYSGTTTNAYIGVLAGGIILGSLAAIYQYYVPVGLPTTALTVVGQFSGLMLGIGILVLDVSNLNSASAYAIITALLIGAQAGVVLPLIWERFATEITGDDAAFVGMVAGYAEAVIGLTMWIIAVQGGHLDTGAAFAVLAAPAGGMLLGAVLCPLVHLGGGRVLKLTLIPLAVGAILLGLGAIVATSAPAVPPATALVGLAATFTLTFVFTSPDEPMPSGPPGATVSLAPTVALVGPRHDSIAAGPGIMGRF
jgi:hypothetical protein